MKGSTARQLYDDAKACIDPAKRTRLIPALDRRMKELDEKERRLQGK